MNETTKLTPAAPVEESVDKHDLEFDATQTQFAAEEPLFEDSTLPVKKESGGLPAKRPLPLLWVGVAGFGVFCLLLAALVAVSQMQSTPVVNLKPSPSPTVVSPVLQTRLEKLQAELDAADPVKPAIVYPQVESDLRLDAATRNR